MPGSVRSSASSLSPAPRGRRVAVPARLVVRESRSASQEMTRSERRKRRTRERLVDAALRIFLTRGYDAATTTEIARAADLGAGTFYCHFSDKRAAFESVAERAARAMMERWERAIDPGMAVRDGVTLALEIAAAYWRENPARARLLLEGGPSFGTAAHLRLVEDLGAVLRNRFTGRRGVRLAALEGRALAALVVGVAIEIGRLVLGGRQATVARLLGLARRATPGRWRVNPRKVEPRRIP